jgi:hypothetical protein
MGYLYFSATGRDPVVDRPKNPLRHKAAFLMLLVQPASRPRRILLAKRRLRVMKFAVPMPFLFELNAPVAVPRAGTRQPLAGQFRPQIALMNSSACT